MYRFIRFVVKILLYSVYRPKIIGKENLIEKGKVVVVSNHKHDFDCALIAAIHKRTLHFLAKDELLNGKLGWVFKRMKIIPVNRREKDHSVVPASLEVIKQDEGVAIFPEGTFNRTGNIIGDFKIGAVKIAHDGDAPIVPIALVSSYKFSFKRFIIMVGKPYKIKSDDLEKENHILMDKVTELLKEGKEYVNSKQNKKGKKHNTPL